MITPLFVLLALALPATGNPTLTIETCVSGFAAETFTTPTSGSFGPVVQAQGGGCVGINAGTNNLEIQPCDGTGSQRWLFKPDGTVQNYAQQGMCWNVLGGKGQRGRRGRG